MLLSGHVKGGVVSLFHVMFKELCHAFSVVRYYVLKGLAFYSIGFTSFLTSWLYRVQSSRKLYLDVRKHCHWSRQLHTTVTPQIVRRWQVTFELTFLHDKSSE